jgi:uncharacterized Zn finger protein (UPF0148 family)
MDEDLLQIFDYYYLVKCSGCNSNLMDPDKKSGQIYLSNAKCPICGVKGKAPPEPKIETANKNQKKSKRQRKQERRERRAARRNAML